MGSPARIANSGARCPNAIAPRSGGRTRDGTGRVAAPRREALRTGRRSWRRRRSSSPIDSRKSPRRWSGSSGWASPRSGCASSKRKRRSLRRGGGISTRPKAQLADEKAELAEQVRELDRQRRQFQETTARQQRALAAQEQQLRKEQQQRDAQLDQRETELDNREAAIEQLRDELRNTEREALEMRLATEETWNQLAGAIAPATLTRSISIVRAKLADHYRQSLEAIAAKSADLETVRRDLAESA